MLVQISDMRGQLTQRQRSDQDIMDGWGVLRMSMDVVSAMLPKISNALLASPADEASPSPRTTLPGRGQAGPPAGSQGASGSFFSSEHQKWTVVDLGRTLDCLVPLDGSALV
jgi:hypothetical protein